MRATKAERISITTVRDSISSHSECCDEASPLPPPPPPPPLDASPGSPLAEEVAALAFFAGLALDDSERAKRKSEWIERYICTTPPKPSPSSSAHPTAQSLPVHPNEQGRLMQEVFAVSPLAKRGIPIQTRVKKHQLYFLTCLRDLKAGEECNFDGHGCRIWLGDSGKELLWSDEYGKISSFDLTRPYSVYFCGTSRAFAPSFTLIRPSGTLAGPFTIESEDILTPWVMTLASIRLAYSSSSFEQAPSQAPGKDLGDTERLDLWQAVRVVMFELLENASISKVYAKIERTMEDIRAQSTLEWSLPLIMYSRQSP